LDSGRINVKGGWVANIFGGSMKVWEKMNRGAPVSSVCQRYTKLFFLLDAPFSVEYGRLQASLVYLISP
jgi:hypothetical protein